MMVILTGPLCLLCLYLAYRCYRIEYHKQTLVLGGFAFFFFILTIVFVGAGYYAWDALKNPVAVVEDSDGNTI